MKLFLEERSVKEVNLEKASIRHRKGNRIRRATNPG